jgi:hypothetical protein
MHVVIVTALLATAAADYSGGSNGFMNGLRGGGAAAAGWASKAGGSGAAPAAAPKDYVLVPGGFMHASCVRPASALPPVRCAHPFLRSNATHGSAWKAWAQVSAPGGGSVSEINSTWVVPGPPVSPSQQTLFFWNGVEPEDTSAVLQPVLQWGSSAAGGGPYWA